MIYAKYGKLSFFDDRQNKWVTVEGPKIKPIVDMLILTETKVEKELKISECHFKLKQFEG